MTAEGRRGTEDYKSAVHLDFGESKRNSLVFLSRKLTGLNVIFVLIRDM